jgi:hypothetical protein
MVLFPAKQQDSQAQPTDIHGEPMRWIIPEPQADMKVGDMLPSGLALYTRNKIPEENGLPIPAATLDSNSSFKITSEFLKRWASILTMHPFEDRESLTENSPKLKNDPARPRSSTVTFWTYLPGENRQPLYVGRLTELRPGASNDWNRPFWEGKSFVDIDNYEPWQSQATQLWKGLDKRHRFSVLSPLIISIACLLTGIYGGVHMVAWGWPFPSYSEEIMWKLSCFLIVFTVPALVLLLGFAVFLEKADESTEWRTSNEGFCTGSVRFDMFLLIMLFILGLGFLFARVFIIVESFISLRRAAVGVFVSPEWVELFPHC